MGAIIYAPLVALIVWYAVNKIGIGFDVTYWQALVGVLVAKVVALYLKNDTDVNVTVKHTKEAEK